jgi:DNA polymerase-1
MPEIMATNRMVRQGAERMAINMPIQGTAADIMKLAMIRVYRRMEEQKLRANLLLQVHDELMFEAPDDEIEPLRELVMEEMPSALKELPSAPEFLVPLDVEVKTGSNWGDME